MDGVTEEQLAAGLKRYAEIEGQNAAHEFDAPSGGPSFNEQLKIMQSKLARESPACPWLS